MYISLKTILLGATLATAVPFAHNGTYNATNVQQTTVSPNATSTNVTFTNVTFPNVTFPNVTSTTMRLTA